MDKVIKTWKCPICGCETVKIVRKAKDPGGIADICDYEYLPTFGGWAEPAPRHIYPYCKEHFPEKKS